MAEPKKRAPRRTKQAAEFKRARVELENESVGGVSAREVVIRGGSAGDVKAETVTLTQGGANAVDAKTRGGCANWGNVRGVVFRDR